MAKFSTSHAPSELSTAAKRMWVSAANKHFDSHDNEDDAKAAGDKAASNVKESSVRAAVFADLAEVGRTLSSANEKKLNSAVEGLASVLATLQKDEDAEADDKPTVKAKTSESNRADHLKQLGLKEAGSEAADDAARGAYLLASLLSIMSDEADEPDQLATLTTAYDAVQQWMKAETDEIGTADDEASTPQWESAPIRKGGTGAIDIREAALTLDEAAVRSDGTIDVKLIDPGWGTSGYYSEAVLREDGPRAYPKGTKMFWDHPTLKEAKERPERSLRDLAAELVSDAQFRESGNQGPGLYATAKVFEAYKPAVDELAPHIGVSIRGSGTYHVGEAEGKTGRIIDNLVEGRSADFVTIAGRGGQVVQLFESYRGHGTSRPAPSPRTQEDDPVELKEALDENKRLKERILLREAKEEAQGFIEEIATKRKVKLAPVTIRRLVESVSADPPADDDGDLDKEELKARTTEAIAAEVKYLSEVTGRGKPRDLGDSPLSEARPLGSRDDDDIAEDTDKLLEGAFGALGLSEAEAKTAAGGRRG